MRQLTAISALIAALLIPATASANDDTEEVIEADARLMLLLDASGSMDDPAGDGLSRIEAARTALNEVVAALPDEAQVGMRVFGAGSDPDDTATRCDDTDLVVPIGPLDRPTLSEQINAYEPRGYTPTGPALLAAADDFDATGRKVIVLLSDGESFCDPDPCEAAEDIYADQNVTVHAVGFGVDDAARAQLECITDASAGTYYDVDDPELLTASLRAISVRALRDETLRGEAIEGADSSTDALPIEPGRYTDTVRGQGTSRYYAIDRPESGGVMITATGHPEHVPNGARREYLGVELMTTEGTVCRRHENDLFRDHINSVLTASVVFSEQTGGETEAACENASRLLVHVFNRGDAEAYPVELTAWTFGEARNLDDLPGAMEDEEFDESLRPATADGDVRNVTGGSTLSDAPALEPGRYRDTIQPGEQLVYRVRADWGQTPRFTATLGADNRADDVLGRGVIGVQARWASPRRQLFNARSNTEAGVNDSARYGGDRPISVTSTVPQIRFTNLDSDVAAISSASTPGYYYFVLETGERQGAEGLAVPFELQVEVDGNSEGVPAFASYLQGPEDELDEAESAAGGDVDGAGFPWLAASLLLLGGLAMVVAAILVMVALKSRRP